MPRAPQTLKNHARLFPPFHMIAMPILLLYVLNSIRQVWLGPSLSSAFALVVAIGIFVGIGSTRQQVLAVQDRLIRLEMQLRLQRVLPADLLTKIGELTVPQLIALRFAADDELPSLCREVLGGTCATPKAIKARVKNWQADYLRA
jgi:uncharacterized protein DUF6526